MAAAGANFGESAGWERVQWFGAPGSPNENHATFGRDEWFERSGAEHTATRSGVTLFDQSSFAHIMVQGPDALALLQRLSTNDVNVAVGRIVYMPWLNERGGMESDVTIARTADEEFLVVTAAVQRTRDLAWLRLHAKGAGHVSVADVSSGYTTLSVMGPRSRELLERVSPADFSNVAFPFATAREIEIGYSLALAFRMSFVGELGWELHIPTEQTLGVYDALMAGGADLGVGHAGYVALNTLRLDVLPGKGAARQPEARDCHERQISVTTASTRVCESIREGSQRVRNAKVPENVFNSSSRVSQTSQSSWLIPSAGKRRMDPYSRC
ncbi:hypothetical protein [Mesorhizobium sp. M0522]|uniref:aminomethyltransferase family protein n=1 Tax=Mesorhizobium sp. M0522 TaxID=2956958 RepID=UPI00333E0ACB